MKCKEGSQSTTGFSFSQRHYNSQILLLKRKPQGRSGRYWMRVLLNSRGYHPLPYLSTCQFIDFKSILTNRNSRFIVTYIWLAYANHNYLIELVRYSTVLIVWRAENFLAQLVGRLLSEINDVLRHLQLKKKAVLVSFTDSNCQGTSFHDSPDLIEYQWPKINLV